MILNGTQMSLERPFALLDSFGQLCGLQVNCEKTKVLWIGSKKGQTKLCAQKKLEMGGWQNQGCRCLVLYGPK